jgi:hypothetical protein
MMFLIGNWMVVVVMMIIACYREMDAFMNSCFQSEGVNSCKTYGDGIAKLFDQNVTNFVCMYVRWVLN